jgi:hypothetical protein
MDDLARALCHGVNLYHSSPRRESFSDAKTQRRRGTQRKQPIRPCVFSAFLCISASLRQKSNFSHTQAAYRPDSASAAVGGGGEQRRQLLQTARLGGLQPAAAMRAEHDVVEFVEGEARRQRVRPLLLAMRVGVPDIDPGGGEMSVAQGFIQRRLVDHRPAPDVDDDGAWRQQRQFRRADQPDCLRRLGSTLIRMSAAGSSAGSSLTAWTATPCSTGCAGERRRTPLTCIPSA